MKQALDSYSEERCIALFERFNINKTWQVPTLVLEHRWVMAHDSAFTNDPRLEYIPGGRPRSWRRMTARSDERVALLLRSFREDLRMVGEMHRRGVPMLVGTDVANEFIYPGFSVHDELELLVEAGLSPLAALQAATLNPAIYLGARDSLGSVETGKMADLVLLDANPLEDIGNTKRIHAVVVGGRLFERTSLDSMLVRARNRR